MSLPKMENPFEAEIKRLKEANCLIQGLWTQASERLRDSDAVKDRMESDIERLKTEVAHWTDMVAQADVACINLRSEIERLKAQLETERRHYAQDSRDLNELLTLLIRAAEALEWKNRDYVSEATVEELVAQLRKAAE